MSSDEELMQRLSGALDEPVPVAPAERIAAVRAAARHTATRRAVTAGPSSSRRGLLLGSAAATVGVVGGVVGTRLASDNDASDAAGPPTESLVFVAGPASVSGSAFAGQVINHTWGVELLLEVTGLPVGSVYAVTYVDRAGVTTGAGGFVGAELPINCRCNGSVLRDTIAAIEIRDGDQAVVSRAEFA